jgi:DNA-binding transcriptional MerR regulator
MMQQQPPTSPVRERPVSAVPSPTAADGAPRPAARQAAPERSTPRSRAARPSEPRQEYYSIGEVCALTELKPHVLRYWETQFRILQPAKNRSGNRVYARREVELVQLVKYLLYTEKYTIDGARQQLDVQRRTGELRRSARAALARETTDSIERELREILDVLEGRRPVSSAAAGGAAEIGAGLIPRAEDA